jgi:hypothetical protein
MEQGLQLLRIDARHRDVRTDAVDHEGQQQKDQSATQVTKLAVLGQLIRGSCHEGEFPC